MKDSGRPVEFVPNMKRLMLRKPTMSVFAACYPNKKIILPVMTKKDWLKEMKRLMKTSKEQQSNTMESQLSTNQEDKRISMVLKDAQNLKKKAGEVFNNVLLKKDTLVSLREDLIEMIVTSMATRMMTLTDDIAKFTNQKNEAEIRLDSAKEKFEKELELCKSFLELVTAPSNEIITCSNCGEQELAPDAWIRFGFKKKTVDGESSWLCSKCFDVDQEKTQEVCEECNNNQNVRTVICEEKHQSLCTSCRLVFHKKNKGNIILRVGKVSSGETKDLFMLECGCCGKSAEHIIQYKDEMLYKGFIFFRLDSQGFKRFGCGPDKINASIWLCEGCSNEWSQTTEDKTIEEFIARKQSEQD